MSGGAAVVSDPRREPVELCAAVLASEGLTARELIACQWQGHGVVVVPHAGRRNCGALDLAPLPTSYTSARVRASRLQAVAVAFESKAGCLAHLIAPAAHCRATSQWLGPVASGGLRGDGPCGRVSVRSGRASSARSAGRERRRRTSPSRPSRRSSSSCCCPSPGSGRGPVQLSGERCFTLAASRSKCAGSRAAGAPISFVNRSLPSFVEVRGPRGIRYDEGCAIYDGAHFVYPAAAPRSWPS